VFFFARSASLFVEWVERRERVLPVKSREKIKLAAAYSGNELDCSLPEARLSGVFSFVIPNVGP
jgi:hypothetical protein